MGNESAQLEGACLLLDLFTRCESSTAVGGMQHQYVEGEMCEDARHLRPRLCNCFAGWVDVFSKKYEAVRLMTEW